MSDQANKELEYWQYLHNKFDGLEKALKSLGESHMLKHVEINQLREKLAIAVEALKYYTSDDPWYAVGYKPWKHGIDGYEALGDTARQALAKIEEKK